MAQWHYCSQLEFEWQIFYQIKPMEDFKKCQTLILNYKDYKPKNIFSTLKGTVHPIL